MKQKHYDEFVMLGLNIAYYRKLRGYTQLRLAELTGIERTHMQRIETAANGVSLDVLFEIAEVLNVPINKLFEFRE